MTTVTFSFHVFMGVGTLSFLHLHVTTSAERCNLFSLQMSPDLGRGPNAIKSETAPFNLCIFGTTTFPPD